MPPVVPIETARERRLRRRRAIRLAERRGIRCPACGLMEPHVCIAGNAWGRIANPEPARVEREPQRGR